MGSTALYCASYQGLRSVVELLAFKGANVNARANGPYRNFTFLKWLFIETCHSKGVHLWMWAQVKVNMVLWNHCVRLMPKSRCRTITIWRHWCTPFVKRCRKSIILLLDLDADVSRVSRKGWSCSAVINHVIQQMLIERSMKSVIFSFFVCFNDSSKSFEIAWTTKTIASRNVEQSSCSISDSIDAICTTRNRRYMYWSCFTRTSAICSIVDHWFLTKLLARFSSQENRTDHIASWFNASNQRFDFIWYEIL